MLLIHASAVAMPRAAEASAVSIMLCSPLAAVLYDVGAPPFGNGYPLGYSELRWPRGISGGCQRRVKAG